MELISYSLVEKLRKFNGVGSVFSQFPRKISISKIYASRQLQGVLLQPPERDAAQPSSRSRDTPSKYFTS